MKFNITVNDACGYLAAETCSGSAPSPGTETALAAAKKHSYTYAIFLPWPRMLQLIDQA